MNDLELEYRKALRRYPKRWRRQHEEALLGVLLDNAEAEGRQHMSRNDHQDLAANITRLWISRAVVALLLLLALVALALIAAVAAGGGDGGAVYFSSVAPSVSIADSSLFAILAVLLLLSATGGTLLLRRNRKRYSATCVEEAGRPRLR